MPWIRGDIRPHCPSLHPGCSHVCPCCGILSPNPSELIDLWQLGTLIKESRALSARREQPWAAGAPHPVWVWGGFYSTSGLGFSRSPPSFVDIWDQRVHPEAPFSSLAFGTGELSRNLPFSPLSPPPAFLQGHALSSPPCGCRNSHGRADQFRPVRYQSVPAKPPTAAGGVPGPGEGDKSTGGRAGWRCLEPTRQPRERHSQWEMLGDRGEERLEAPGWPRR